MPVCPLDEQALLRQTLKLQALKGVPQAVKPQLLTLECSLVARAYIYRFTVDKICVQHSFSTTITTNGGAAQVRGNFANRWPVF